MILISSCQPQESAAQTFARAEQLYKAGMVADAQTVCEDAIKKDPNFAPPYRALAEMATTAGDAASAIQYWEDYLQREPTGKHGWCQLAQREMEVGLEISAREHAEKELEHDPNCPRAHVQLGALFLRIGSTNNALTHFEKAAALMPDQPQLKRSYGMVLALAGQYDKAEEILKPLSEGAGKNKPDVHYWLGYTFSRRARTPQDRADAEKNLRLALKSQPNYASAQYELGRLLVQEKRFAEAIPLLESALSHDRYDPAVPFSLQQAYTAVKQMEKAERVRAEFKKRSDWDTRRTSLLRTYATNRKDVTTLLALGELDIERQAPQTALVFLQGALSLEPENAKIKAAMEKAQKQLAATSPPPQSTPLSGDAAPASP